MWKTTKYCTRGENEKANNQENYSASLVTGNAN